jgi:ferredoxin, 2Fe-2S
MATITYITVDGQAHTLEVAKGVSVMQGAVNGGIGGIDADCGGSAACATCHVHVAREWIKRLPTRSENESSMLEFAVDADESSRLSCQIVVNDDLNGLVVRVPATQR